jgi:DNA-binding CsgD family transcriptional regulator
MIVSCVVCAMPETRAKVIVTEALTLQEQAVAEAMRTAASEADAARKLGLSRHTVHNYLRSARAKRNVRTTRALVASLGSRHEQA